MRRVAHRKFIDQAVSADDCAFFDCEFDGCLIEVDSGATEFERCKFKDCLFEGAWPDWVLSLNPPRPRPRGDGGGG